MRYRTTTGTAILATAALLLAACSSGDSTDDATGGAADGDTAGRTLTLWHYEGEDSAMAQGWNAAIDLFEEETGATVELEIKTFEQINASASQILNSDEAPDVMEYNKGNATAGLLSSQGLLAPLDDAVAKYGWDTKLNEALATTARYEDGVMGSGSWYGVPNYGEFVFLYLNTDLFAEHGIEIPTTFDELTAAMDAFVAAGVTPMTSSAAEYPLGQLWYQLALTKADRAWVEAYQLYTDTVDWSGPEITFATQTLADWVERGYLSTDVSGQAAEDAGVQFINGEFPMFFSGSWWYGRMLAEATSFELGITNFPGTTLTPGSSGNLWVVPENSANKDLAETFIDITMRPEIQAIIGNTGGLPVAAAVEDITDPDSQQLIELFNEVNDRAGLAFYPDWATPTMYNDLNAALQELVNGTISAPDFQVQLGDQYEAHVGPLR